MMNGNGGETSGDNRRLAPVTPLFGSSPSERHPARRASAGSDPLLRPKLRALESIEGAQEASDPAYGSAAPPKSADEVRADAEQLLLRKLRQKALSESEARLVLRGAGASDDDAEEIIDDCLRRGYIDDRMLAELLVRAGVERRHQGRAVLARSLAQRGLGREVIDEALAELPDDDGERALEYARTKSRSLSRLDAEVALRRLLGQLARRGFGGSLAMQAAKQALREASMPPETGVRFRESD